NVFARRNFRFWIGAGWLSRGGRRNSDLQSTIRQFIRRAIGRADLLDPAPDIIRAIEQLHGFISLRHLFQDAPVLRFAVQRLLKSRQRVCGVAPLSKFFALLQQLIDDRWSRRSSRYCWRSRWLRHHWRWRICRSG